MMMLTVKIKKHFEKVGDQSAVEDPVIIVKFFNPCGAQTWYCTEYDPETDILTCYVTGTDFPEWGSVFLHELASKQPPLGLTMERDYHFHSCLFSELPEIKKQREREAAAKDGFRFEVLH